MLIDSTRLTAQDRAHWRRLARYDRLLAGQLPLDDMADKARDTIQVFAEQGPCYVSTSWGKDSMVVAHLAATSGLHLPLVWVRVEKWENPDCTKVRDAFLDRYGEHVDYHEYAVEATAPRWWESNAETVSGSRRTSRGGFTLAERDHGDRHISGIRAEESRVRAIAQARWGDASGRACRPIGRWSAVEVFAYLERHDLPVHPAYAMSVGGRLDRRWLRVSSLGGVRGADRGRSEWESTYYPDVVGQ
ncbi:MULTISPECIES: phosphoadenosine phosphosulfate reductase family protein [Corynebacterium]|uniref:phosphoadenosine phosphosulfate reductase domain-containing protein n=1 Tax=Corynebacterium TaxID=1716 RepID=UPI00124BDA32